MEDILRIGIDVVLVLQTASPTLDWPLLVITQLGSEMAMILLATLVYWCIDRRLGLRLALLIVTSALVNTGLKLLFGGPRPYRFDPRVKLIGPPEQSPGLPSGHTQLSATFWGVAAWRGRRRWGWVAATALVAMVAASRLYLGVHFPHDLLVGFALGLVAVVAFALVEGLRARRRGQDWEIDPCRSFCTAVVVAAALAATGQRDALVSAGILVGLTGGAWLSLAHGSFESSGSTGQRAGRFVVGAIGLIGLYVGARLAFGRLAPPHTFVWGALRLVRYALVGLWVAGLWPLLSVRLGLTRRPPDLTGAT